MPPNLGGPPPGLLRPESRERAHARLSSLLHSLLETHRDDLRQANTPVNALRRKAADDLPE